MKRKVVKQYAQVIKKDGLKGCAVEVLYSKDTPTEYIIDIGTDETNWDQVVARDEDIESASDWEDVEV